MIVLIMFKINLKIKLQTEISYNNSTMLKADIDYLCSIIESEIWKILLTD